MLKPAFNTNRMDVDSLELESGTQIELQHFIPVQHDAKITTRQETRTARVQFLALCWSLFLMGWTDGSTGPLLPRIQESYKVGFPCSFLTVRLMFEFCRLGSKQCLGYLCWDVRSVMFIGSWHDTRCGVSSRPYLATIFQGVVLGALLNMPLIDRLGLGKVS